MKNFLFKTALGGFLKVAIGAIGLELLQKGSIYLLSLKDLLNVAVIATIPVIINALNRSDSRYGLKNKKKGNEDI